MRGLWRIVWSLWLAGALMACHRRPLEDPNGPTEVRVRLNKTGGNESALCIDDLCALGGNSFTNSGNSAVIVNKDRA